MSGTGCSSETTEPFALRVLGDSMEPEFEDGAVIIVDPAAPCGNGAYAVIEYDDDVIFRQFVREDGREYLRPLNEAYETTELSGGYQVRGVVIQKNYKRKRKHYDWTDERVGGRLPS